MLDGNEINFVLLENIIEEVGADKHVPQLFTKKQNNDLCVIYLTQNSFHLTLFSYR